MKDSHVFYAGVHEPKQLRRDVLTSQKAILDCLKKFEHIRSLRQEKELRMLELKKMLSALRIISGQLKTRLPANAMKVAPHRVEAPMPVPVKRSAPRKPAVHQKSKIEMLEDELAKIESKLSTIE
ncbi:MAG TPA: hypothetical protein VLJ21_01490 [Candidatus Binatia bacterium]|nr:hypothetical protein [Candidatus Binatia bacterium]